MADKLDALPAGTLGSYEIRGKLGSGGMGDVFDAVHKGLNKRVAIKTLRKRFLDDEIVVARFLREGQLASRIRHPNIVDVTDVGMMGGLPCLVMEHLEGESFSALIRREKAIAIERIVDILLPIVAAVDFAHDHGIVHRDLKPSNIFLSRSWNGEVVPKVLDFGISKLVHEAQESALTTDSAFVGTPHYASPELMRADKQADGRSDQYSMGVILYEAATGTRPFAEIGNNFVALAMAICKGEYPPATNRNPNVPPAFDRVIQRAMALHPEERFLTMRALGEALLPFASERARVIWAPTFQGKTGEVPVVGEVRAAGPTSETVQTGSKGGQGGKAPEPFAATGPNPQFPTYPTHPSQPSGMHAFSGPPSSPSTTPPGFERLPTYPTYGTGRPVASPRGNGLITAVVGASVVVAILVSVIVLKGGVGGGKTGETTTAASAAPATFVLDVSANPPTAAIELDGAAAGTGRIVKTLPKDGAKHALRITAPGHEPYTREFDADSPPPVMIPLKPIAAAPSATPTHQPTQKAGGKATGGKKGDGRPKTDNIDPWE
ncbi:MAG: serine/threonine protein kinase [Labilithrix sp.]|nr:serine/threonine protein kinase [Labilithrix sp.]MCW5813832.1 serine/threonine protein kinase [Labilithrix sp.]